MKKIITKKNDESFSKWQDKCLLFSFCKNNLREKTKDLTDRNNLLKITKVCKNYLAFIFVKGDEY